jgi:D-3-phosphoglycerate dehydrogenase / 2-oxoglutarate reductase
MHKILIADKFSLAGLDVFKTEPDITADVRTGLTPQELIGMVGNYDALLVRSETRVTADVIAAAKRLKIIGRAGVGLDNVDIAAATRAGVIVMNTPDGNTTSAAEHTMAMMMALARNIPQADASLKSGKWERGKFMGTELYGKTLGVIGLGRIGGEVARRARAFSMRIVAFDPFASKARVDELGAELLDLDPLLKTSDFITVHAPKTKDTAHLIGERELNLMKKTVRLINVARGGIYDETALTKAIEAGQIAGVALDVFEKEPPGDHPLLGFSNVIVTPHLGASTEEAQENVAVALARQVVDALKGRTIANAVNIPAIDAAEWQRIRPYYALAEKLGSFMAQFAAAKYHRILIEYAGEVADRKTQAITLVLLAELMKPIVGEDVNYVNAPLVAKEHGVEITESVRTESTDYQTLIKVEATEDDTIHSISATLSSNGEPRITEIDGYRVDIKPEGSLIIFFNRDVPGILARVASILGNANINIAGLTNGRKAIGGDAVTVISVDNDVRENILTEIRSTKDIQHVQYVEL